MSIREELEKDSRFSIDETEMDALFKYHTIYGYEFIKIPIGKIRRYKNKRLGTLYDTENYEFLIHPNSSEARERYREYCDQKSNTKDNANRSEATFELLIANFDNSDYDPQKAVIIIDQYNCIVDGLHRSCILLNKFGEEYIVPVVKLRIKCGNRIKILSPLYELRSAVRSLTGQRHH